LVRVRGLGRRGRQSGYSGALLCLWQLQRLGCRGPRPEDVGVGLLLVLRDVFLRLQLGVVIRVLTNSFELGLQVLLHPERNEAIGLVRCRLLNLLE